MRAWNTTCSSRSPSSSLRSSRLSRSIASATSYASSIVYGAMVAKFCSRSHGQPVFGVRSAAMMASKRSISREGVMKALAMFARTYQTLVIAGSTAASRPGVLHRIALRDDGRLFVCRASCLEQEPGAPLGAVDKVLQKTRGCRVVVLFGKLVTFAHRGRDVLVVVHQFAQHIVRGNKRVVVVGDRLQLRNMTDRAEGRAADPAPALRQLVRRREDLFGLLVEQKMVVAKMRAADVPVEILGLQVERKCIRQ